MLAIGLRERLSGICFGANIAQAGSQFSLNFGGSRHVWPKMRALRGALLGFPRDHLAPRHRSASVSPAPLYLFFARPGALCASRTGFVNKAIFRPQGIGAPLDVRGKVMWEASL